MIHFIAVEHGKCKKCKLPLYGVRFSASNRKRECFLCWEHFSQRKKRFTSADEAQAILNGMNKAGEDWLSAATDSPNVRHSHEGVWEVRKAAQRCLHNLQEKDKKLLAHRMEITDPVMLRKLQMRLRHLPIPSGRRGTEERYRTLWLPRILRYLHRESDNVRRIEVTAWLWVLRSGVVLRRKIAIYTLGEIGAKGFFLADNMDEVRITLEMHLEQDTDAVCRAEAESAIEKIVQYLGSRR